MVRSSKNVKRAEMLACGDNAMIKAPYYLRHSTRGSAKLQVCEDIPKQNVNDEPSIKIMGSWSNRKYKYCSYCFTGLLVVSFCIILFSKLFPYPLYASCIVQWKFNETCTYVMQKFRWQIIDSSSWNTCLRRNDNCIYMLNIPAEENVIRATHVALNSKVHEKIKIVFEEVNNTCFATANSVSNKWFTIFDYGVNYCNLHNLVVGAGFDRYTKFLELTSDAICTQFNMAICE